MPSAVPEWIELDRGDLRVRHAPNAAKASLKRLSGADVIMPGTDGAFGLGREMVQRGGG